jgi:hypothetical protein
VGGRRERGVREARSLQHVAFEAVFAFGAVAIDSGNQQCIAVNAILEMRLTSPMADVIRVQIRHHHPQQNGVRAFDLDYLYRNALALSKTQWSHGDLNPVRLATFYRKTDHLKKLNTEFNTNEKNRVRPQEVS